MKLRNLSGAIRKHAGAPKIIFDTPNGPLTLELVKNTLVQALKDSGLDGQAEVGLTLTDDGFLVVEQAHDADGDVQADAAPEPTISAAPASPANPLAGLLG